MRVQRLDILRGYAVALMVLDHVLFVLLDHSMISPGFEWFRLTITRPALPLFMLVAGYLLCMRGRPSGSRVITTLAAAVVASIASRVCGMGFPEILSLYLVGVLLAPLLVRWPVQSLTVGLLQSLYLPLWGPSAYQPGLVVAWLSLGVVWAQLKSFGDLLQQQTNSLANGCFSVVGRNALAIYVGHLLLLSAAIHWAKQ